MAIEKLVIGSGYLGKRVARTWRDGGANVHVTTRSTERASTLRREGFTVHQLDVTRPETLVTLSNLTNLHTVLYAVGYDRTGSATRHAVYQTGLQNVLDHLSVIEDRIVFISSTGVYGQTNGQWVDESCRCEPQAEGGRHCLAAEKILLNSAVGDHSVILRLAGIYGPDRIPFLKRLERGESLPVAATGYLNLIHVDDAVAAVLTAEEARLPACYLVADGHPIRRSDFYREMGRHLNVEPRFELPATDSSRAQRARSNKRVSSRRIVSELGITWRWPDYRKALAALLSNSHAG